jgi:Na+/proline symporter
MHAPTVQAGRDVSFGALIEKVRQAETALESNERQAAAAWRQLKATWVAGWTPGRIVIAGFLSGFVVGKAEPVRRVARGGGTLQLLSALAGLFAGGSAQAAAGEAEQAAKSAEQTAAAVSPEAALAASAQHAAPPMYGPADA